MRKFKRLNLPQFEKPVSSQNAQSEEIGQGVFIFVLNCSGTRVACGIFRSAAGTAASTGAKFTTARGKDRNSVEPGEQ